MSVHLHPPKSIGEVVPPNVAKCYGRVTYTWPPERDKVAEAEVSKLNLPEECRNIVSGCKFTAHGLDIVRSHEIDCLFREVVRF